ncbi:LAETG motif-containing sortase-dependent surface protein [Streptomyces sp. NPDC003635]
MNRIRMPATLAVTAFALVMAPGAAQAHEGAHPFENCSEAYANGYSNISEGDEHYGSHLDRDGDGIGCDQPPAGFVPREEAEEAGPADEQDQDLAATGGNSATPYLAGGGAVVVLAGGGVLLAVRRRRTAAE